MNTRRYSWPEGHWDWYRHLAFKHGVEVGGLIFVGGQVDKSDTGEPLRAFDLEAQTGVVVRHIDKVLEGFGSSMKDVVKLTVFYLRGETDEDALVADIGRHVLALGGDDTARAGPVISMVPLPCLALPGMTIEIEAVAVPGRHTLGKAQKASNAGHPRLLPMPFSHGLRCGEHAWLSAQSARTPAGAPLEPNDAIRQTPLIVHQAQRLLSDLGLELDDTVKLGCWYAGDGRRSSWWSHAASRAAWFERSPPACTELPTRCLPDGEAVRLDFWAMRADAGATLERHRVQGAGRVPGLPYPTALACGDLVFLSGLLPLDEDGSLQHPGDLNAQTRYVMESIRAALETLGLGLDHMVKQTSFYLGDADPAVIVANQTLRSGYYTEPAGVSTGVPLPSFTLEDVCFTGETIAMR